MLVFNYLNFFIISCAITVLVKLLLDYLDKVSKRELEMLRLEKGMEDKSHFKEVDGNSYKKLEKMTPDDFLFFANWLMQNGLIDVTEYNKLVVKATPYIH